MADDDRLRSDTTHHSSTVSPACLLPGNMITKRPCNSNLAVNSHKWSSFTKVAAFIHAFIPGFHNPKRKILSSFCFLSWHLASNIALKVHVSQVLRKPLQYRFPILISITYEPFKQIRIHFLHKPARSALRGFSSHSFTKLYFAADDFVKFNTHQSRIAHRIDGL